MNLYPRDPGVVCSHAATHGMMVHCTLGVVVEREAEGPGVAVQPERLLQPLLLQAQGFAQVGTRGAHQVLGEEIGPMALQRPDMVGAGRVLLG